MIYEIQDYSSSSKGRLPFLLTTVTRMRDRLIYLFYAVKKNMNATKPHGQLKCLGGNIGCEDKNSSWYLKGSPR